MLKLAKWRVGLLEPFPTLPPSSKAYACTGGKKNCIWAEFVANAPKIFFSSTLCSHMEISSFNSKRMSKKRGSSSFALSLRLGKVVIIEQSTSPAKSCKVKAFSGTHRFIRPINYRPDHGELSVIS